MGKSLKKLIHFLLIMLVACQTLIPYKVVPNANAVEGHGWALSIGSSYSETMPYHIALQNGDIAFAGTQNDGTKNNLLFMIVNKNGIEKPNSKKIISLASSAIVRSVSKKPNGNIIIAGDAENTVSDYFVVELDSTGNVVNKLDSMGNCVNPFTIGGSNAEHLYTVIGTSDNGMILGGFSYTFTSMGEYYLVKLDQNNKVEWSKYYFNHAGFYNSWVSGHPYHTIIETSDGGFMVGAYVYPGMNSDDFYLLKLDKFGNKQWGKMYGYNGADWTSSVAQAQDGGYIISGTSTNLGSGSWDVLTVKTDSSGNISWANTYGSASVVDWSVRTIATSDGGYANLWNDFGYVNPSYLTKMDQNGQIVWVNRVGSTYSKKMVSLSQGDSDDLIVSGHITLDSMNREDFLIMCFDKNGRIYSDEISNFLSTHFSNNFPIVVLDQVSNVLHQNYNPVLYDASFQPVCFGFSELGAGSISTNVLAQNPDLPVDDDPDPDEYPILLVHGFQLAAYNPILYSASLIENFTGQSLHLSSNGKFDRSHDDKRKAFITLEHLQTDLIGTMKQCNEHYLLKIAKHNSAKRDVYVSDYSYRTLFDDPRSDRGLANAKDFDDKALYEYRAQTRDHIRVFAKNLKREIDAIKNQTGAEKVVIIAHSMGGLVARTYIEEKDFDSTYAKKVWGNDDVQRRMGLPKYDNDVHHLIICGTPNHGTPTSGLFYRGSAALKGNYCVTQMAIDSAHLKILNYENDTVFKKDTNPNVNHLTFTPLKDDILNEKVYYHVLAGVIPKFSENLELDTQQMCHFFYKDIDQIIEELENVLDLGENFICMEGRADRETPVTAQVFVNYSRLYSIAKGKSQNWAFNHIVFHADHGHVYRSDESFDLISKLLLSPTQKVHPSEYWNFYGKFSYAEYLARLHETKRELEGILDQGKDAYNQIKDRVKDFIPFTAELLPLLNSTNQPHHIKALQNNEDEDAMHNMVLLAMQNGQEYVELGPMGHVWSTTRNAFVNHIEGNIQWFNPASNDFIYSVEGLANNTYNIRLRSSGFEDNEQGPKVFEQNQLPTQENQTDHIHINWDTQEVVFESDLDGDGEIDRRITPPGAPSGLSASVNFRHVQLNWQGSRMGTHGIRGYRVYRASTSSEEFIPIAFIDIQRPMTFDQHIAFNFNGGNEFSYLDTSGLTGESYTYYVVAEDDQLMNSISSNLVRTDPLSEKPFPHLRISAELNKPTFSKDETAMIMVTVMNQGNATASNTRVKMTLPQDLSFLRASRYRSVVQTPAIIEFELGAIAPNSVQTFQVDVKVLVAVSQIRSIPIHFDVNCTEKSSDFAHVMLQLVPQRSGRPDLYLGLYYRNASWDPQTSSIFIPQVIALEVDFVLTGAQLPYELNIDWGDGSKDVLSQQKDLRQTLRHQFKTKGKLKITITVTDQLQRSKTATISMEVR